MGFSLSARSRSRLAGVHHDLVRVVGRAIHITPVDFTVLEGLRSIERQRQLVASGASTTLRSRHLTGHAVDIAPVVGGAVSWDWAHYGPLAEAVKHAAAELGVPIEWGGDWTSFRDGPHWQLPWTQYPEGSNVARAAEPVSPPAQVTHILEPSAESAGGPIPPRADAKPTTNLNIRKAPLPLGGTIVTMLPAGAAVEVVETWSLARVLVDGKIVEGWVADRYLDRA